MYIETSRTFNPGTYLMIRRSSRSLSQAAGETLPPFLCLAKVKWTKELDDENNIRFGVGVSTGG
jgi:hypothetical protein